MDVGGDKLLAKEQVGCANAAGGQDAAGLVPQSLAPRAQEVLTVAYGWYLMA